MEIDSTLCTEQIFYNSAFILSYYYDTLLFVIPSFKVVNGHLLLVQSNKVTITKKNNK